jgi:hypothetical protein
MQFPKMVLPLVTWLQLFCHGLKTMRNFQRPLWPVALSITETLWPVLETGVSDRLTLPTFLKQLENVHQEE